MATKFIRVPIEVDITYVNKTWFSNRPKNDVRHYVIGFFQRAPKPTVIIEALPDNEAETIVDAILRNAQAGSMLYAEAGILPAQIKEVYEVSEMENERVTGDVHVNNVRNVWKDLKRTIKQTHIQVSQKHLQLYCNEVAWRINNRHLSATEKFNLLLSNSFIGGGRKGSYKNLIK